MWTFASSWLKFVVSAIEAKKCEWIADNFDRDNLMVYVMPLKCPVPSVKYMEFNTYFGSLMNNTYRSFTSFRDFTQIYKIHNDRHDVNNDFWKKEDSFKCYEDNFLNPSYWFLYSL